MSSNQVIKTFGCSTGTLLKGVCIPLQWRHNGHDSISNHQPYECFLNRLFRRRSKKTSKLRVTGLCAGNSPETGEFPAQMASNAGNVSIWWRHHAIMIVRLRFDCAVLFMEKFLKCIYTRLIMMFSSTSLFKNYCSGVSILKSDNKVILYCLVCRVALRAPLKYNENLSRYRNSHYKDKTVTRPSYLNNRIPTHSTASLYWDGSQVYSHKSKYKIGLNYLAYGVVLSSIKMW